MSWSFASAGLGVFGILWGVGLFALGYAQLAGLAFLITTFAFVAAFATFDEPDDDDDDLTDWEESR